MRGGGRTEAEAMAELAVIIAAALLVCLVAGSLLSCRSQRTAATTEIERMADTREIARHDTVRETRIRTDSVVVRDSVFTLIKGDTVLIHEWHWRERTDVCEREKAATRRDTAWRTLTRYIHKTRTVERELTAWEKFRIGAFWWLIGAVVAAAAAGWKLRHRKK